MYRVKEFCGKYQVEVKVNETSGCLWWKKEKTDWRISTNTGIGMFDSRFQTRLKTYKI